MTELVGLYRFAPRKMVLEVSGQLRVFDHQLVSEQVVRISVTALRAHNATSP